MQVRAIFLVDSLNESYGHVLAKAALKYTKKKRLPQTAENLEMIVSENSRGFRDITNRMIADRENSLSPEERAIVNEPVIGADDPDIWERAQIPMVSAIYAHFLQQARY